MRGRTKSMKSRGRITLRKGKSIIKIKKYDSYTSEKKAKRFAGMMRESGYPARTMKVKSSKRWLVYRPKTSLVYKKSPVGSSFGKSKTTKMSFRTKVKLKN